MQVLFSRSEVRPSAHLKRSWLRYVIGGGRRVLSCTCCLSVVIAAQGCKDSALTSADAPAVPAVQALRIAARDLPIQLEFVGQTKGAVDAEIRARVEGVVTDIHFQEGKEVKEGQVLYSIDPAPYDAKVAQAKGKLAEAETILVKAQSDLKRVRPLVAMKALSERDLDRSVAQEGAARASVEAARAVVQSAEIERGYCQITAPTSGVIGLTKAKVGELVGRAPNPVVLNVVSKLDPIHVKFSISEAEYLQFSRMRQKEIEQGVVPTKRELRVTLADGLEYPESGYITSVERAIDPTTGTIAMEAAFPNPHQLLRPGQFAKVHAVGETLKGVVVIPKRALRELQGQFQVVVVGSDNRVSVRTVTLGPVVGAEQVVRSGLGAGEVIVTEGVQRLRDGMEVNPEVAG
jgi:membrane fusion protein (multidrug efflux system)